MLKGLSPLLTPELLHILASMGHGDEIVLADANFPAATHAKRLVRLPGLSAPAVLDAVLSVLPLDNFVTHAALTMQVVGDAAVREGPEVPWRDELTYEDQLIQQFLDEQDEFEQRICGAGKNLSV